MERTVEGTGALYGSVTPRIICDAVRVQLNIALPESRLFLPEPIRMIGLHRVPLLLRMGVDNSSDAFFMSVLVKDANEAAKIKHSNETIADADAVNDSDAAASRGRFKKQPSKRD